MAGLQRSAVRALHAALRSVAGEPITVRRPGKDALTLVAPQGLTRIASDGDDGNALTTVLADWIVDTAAYDFGDGPTFPRRGDEIDWIDPDAVKRTFHVLPRDDDRCYRFTDQTRALMRIHVVEKTPNAETLL